MVYQHKPCDTGIFKGAYESHWTQAWQEVEGHMPLLLLLGISKYFAMGHYPRGPLESGESTPTVMLPWPEPNWAVPVKLPVLQGLFSSTYSAQLTLLLGRSAAEHEWLETNFQGAWQALPPTIDLLCRRKELQKAPFKRCLNPRWLMAAFLELEGAGLSHTQWHANHIIARIVLFISVINALM